MMNDEETQQKIICKDDVPVGTWYERIGIHSSLSRLTSRDTVCVRCGRHKKRAKAKSGCSGNVRIDKKTLPHSFGSFSLRTAASVSHPSPMTSQELHFTVPQKTSVYAAVFAWLLWTLLENQSCR
jgi:hypothetical protein